MIVNIPAPAGIATLAAYIATIPAVTHIGALPVGFGYEAPAGVYMVGLALVLRDLAREAAGRRAILAAIALGTVVSSWPTRPWPSHRPPHSPSRRRWTSPSTSRSAHEGSLSPCSPRTRWD
ncbi:hypothetical protein [Streptomyces oceani]|uniref:hypothetical protein n=1 Tax=Streptomyces oceani TaxID=1075402 RepID=UPI001FCCFBAB|nr:hypothetical protein [Streptomyces oceani]